MASPEQRLRDLESQVRHLTMLVERLLMEKKASAEQPATAPPLAEPVPPATGVAHPDIPREAKPLRRTSYGGDAQVTSDVPLKEKTALRSVRHRLDRALRVDSGETIEAHIGSVWLSRLAILVFMTAMALAARTTFWSERIGPPEKVMIGYAMALAFIGYGSLSRKGRDLFGQVLLGGGLAGLYFTTYAAFFIEQVQVFNAPLWAVPVLLGCLAFMAAVAHLRRCLTVAGIAFFLAYYTVVVSCTQQTPSLENMVYALFTSAGVAVATLVFHAAHRWILFTWLALIATHLTHIFFFFRQPAGLEIPSNLYFWISNGFLTVCFILFSLTCIVDARKTGEYRRMVAPMSGVNSAFFLVLTWLAIRAEYPLEQWMFRLGTAGLFLIFAVLAEMTGPRRNYLFQIYIAKVVIMLTLALQAYLSDSGEKLLVAMAIECLALGFSYKRSGIVVFKVLGLLLMLITFVGCLFALRMEGVVHMGPLTAPSNWFSALGVAVTFQIVAWFYEKFVRPLRREQRISGGQSFLADTFLDLHGMSMAVLHAAAGAMVLLAITIIERADDPTLPFLLAGEALLLAAMGLVLFTPQIEVASVLLLAAAHMCYHVFLWLPPPEIRGFAQQEGFVLYTLLLAAFTYGGAHAWERYLKRFHREGEEWEHHAVAAAPYLAATAMLITLIYQHVGVVYAPAVHGSLAAALLLVGLLTGYFGVKTSGLVAMGAGVVQFYWELYNPAAPLARQDGFLPYFLIFLGTFVAAERIIVSLNHRETATAGTNDVLRTGLVTLLALLSFIGLYKWSPENLFVLHLLAVSVVLIALGALFRESRYRWGALALFAIITARAFMLLRNLDPIYQVLTFGTAAVVLLVVSWAYSRMRRKALSRDQAVASGDAILCKQTASEKRKADVHDR